MTISFPFALILIPYAVILMFFAVFATVNVFHLVGHGADTGVSFVVTFLFLAGAGCVLFFTWQGVRDVDWSTPVSFSIPSLSPGSFGKP
ncbi:MAG: hypothetical protein RLZZ324_406 [Candidatus Parcubacteria bacterium]|jgi:hypothetical protein